MEVLGCSLLLLLLHFHTSDGVRCFSRFVPSSLTCEGELGEVDQDTCCLNSDYGYQTTQDGLCHSCGSPSWSSWSVWSQSTSLCGEGVRLRRRRCVGIGQCSDEGKLQAEIWNGTCCDGDGWKPWSDWSACSVSCGEGGSQQRFRKCTDRPECALACSGEAEETQKCTVTDTCPVHGSWSEWGGWSECSATCIPHHDETPRRVRHRSCSSPPPSEHPPGQPCHGNDVDNQPCTELPKCPVDGGWGPWSAFGACSVSCGEGLQLSHRSCNQPPPQYLGRQCEGPGTRTSACTSPCPVEFFWTDWSTWSSCSGTCLSEEGAAPQRSRHRSCIDPSGGARCEGPTQDSGPCLALEHCKVHGHWGQWSAFSACPVTCGVGLLTSTRFCDSPAPKHGGQSCAGDDRRHQICNTKLQCPVDGVWSEWGAWGPCEEAHDPNYRIRCTKIGGSQSRRRKCLHTGVKGAPCPRARQSDIRTCYNVERCKVSGEWESWGPWSYCNPPCGGGSSRTREMKCKPIYKGYSPTVGLTDEVAAFFGEPKVTCEGSPITKETQDCVNVPPCD